MRFDARRAVLIATLLVGPPAFAKENPRPLAGLDAWLSGRDLCADSAALVVPVLAGLVRGDAPAAPADDGG